MPDKANIGLLHPGAMGASVGAALQTSGHQVAWVTDGRSSATAERASAFLALETLAQLVEEVDAIVSVCPPESALDVASAVNKLGFDGVYVDANAISPRTAQDIAQLFANRFVDGGLIGPPANQPGTTRLYLSGPQAATVQAWFSAGPLDARVLAGDVVAASSLKMSYAAFTKGSSGLLLAVRALAESLGVGEALEAEWQLSQAHLPQQLERTARGVAPKAWRFVGEMNEIAATFDDNQLPAEFHFAAANIYERLASLKNANDAAVDEVITLLLQQPPKT